MKSKWYIYVGRRFSMFADPNSDEPSVPFKYAVFTADPLHVYGEIYYCTFERIYRLSFRLATSEDDLSLLEEYVCKYPIGANCSDMFKGEFLEDLQKNDVLDHIQYIAHVPCICADCNQKCICTSCIYRLVCHHCIDCVESYSNGIPRNPFAKCDCYVAILDLDNL